MQKNSIFTDCPPGSILCLYLFLLYLCFVCLECANPVEVGPQQMLLQCGTLTGQTSWITNPFSRASPLSYNSSPQYRLLCPFQHHDNPSSLRTAPHSKLCLAPSYCCSFPLRSLFQEEGLLYQVYSIYHKSLQYHDQCLCDMCHHYMC